MVSLRSLSGGHDVDSGYKVHHILGSSRGRGNRAAAWFADYLVEQHDLEMQSLVLSGGIKGWVAEKGDFVRHMQEYDESKWA